MNTNGRLQAPFPYFGGKSRCAAEVWEALGAIENFAEPFCGSCAVLLSRSDPIGTETINDLDGFLTNCWRALRDHPEEMAIGASDQVNEIDLESRHKALVTVCRDPACKAGGECATPDRHCKWRFLREMKDDEFKCDVGIAWRWLWGACAWIGRGWCAGEWWGRGSAMNNGDGVNVRDEVRGGKRPQLHRSQGVHRKLPQLHRGQGVHRQLPHLGDAGRGECERRRQALREWFGALADRLRNVRVCSGDWTRVCGPTPTVGLGLTGLFIDPPYSAESGRDNDIYREEDLSVAHDVRAWCLAHGADRRLRIVLAGYEGEHNSLEEHGWRVVCWTAHGGYGVQRAEVEYTNRYRERLWVSPHCLVGRKEMVLF